MLLNGQIYMRCPKAIYLESQTGRYLVDVYFSCKDMGVWPAPGGYGDQTAFTIELFQYIHSVVEESRVLREKEAQQAASSKKKPSR